MVFEDVKSLIERECEKYGVHFQIEPTPTVMIGSIESNGVFISPYIDIDGELTSPILMVGTNQSTLETMVHEYHHMIQYIEDPEIYNRLSSVCDVWGWIDRNPETDSLSDDDIDEALALYYAIEVDCERRSTEFHIKNDTGVNIDEYIQKANAYTTFYLFVRENRVWYTPGLEPYHIEDVWRMMPKTFDFDVIGWYDSHHKLFNQCIGKQND